MDKKAFVIGDPIAHSKSPMVHGHWLKTLGLNGTYEAIHVLPDGVEKFVQRIRAGDFIGGNFTIPHKEIVLTLVDELSDAAKHIGAVNTVWMEGAKLVGHNTDAYGFGANLDQFAPEWKQGNTALIIGAGGASRAVIYTIMEAGFEKVTIANRTLSRAQALANHFGEACNAIALEDVADLTSSADFIVNTSSIGMDGEGDIPVDFSTAKRHAIVTDIVYTPLETPFLLKAKDQGLKTVDGLGMLLHQAVPGFEKWFGVLPEVTDELRQLVLNSGAKG